jgi:hypothetical protein
MNAAIPHVIDRVYDRVYEWGSGHLQENSPPLVPAIAGHEQAVVLIAR